MRSRTDGPSISSDRHTCSHASSARRHARQFETGADWADRPPPLPLLTIRDGGWRRGPTGRGVVAKGADGADRPPPLPLLTIRDGGWRRRPTGRGVVATGADGADRPQSGRMGALAARSGFGGSRSRRRAAAADSGADLAAVGPVVRERVPQAHHGVAAAARIRRGTGPRVRFAVGGAAPQRPPACRVAAPQQRHLVHCNLSAAALNRDPIQAGKANFGTCEYLRPAR